MAQSFSTNIGLSALPEYDQQKDPAVYAELLRIRNAFQVLQGAIDGLGGAGGTVVTHSGGNFITGQPIIAANNAGDTISMTSSETAGFVMTAVGPGVSPIWAALAGLTAIADKRILSNISGASALPIGNTLSALIDSILGSSQGQLITRNAGGWTVLSPSTGGKVLTENGAGANLSWNTPGGPAFSSYATVTTAVPANTLTKIGIQTSEFDIGTYFSTANSKYQPLVAGYYQINWHMMFETGSPVYVLAILYKNGARYKDGTFSAQAAAAAGGASSGSSLVFLNGTTDFLELWGFAGAANTTSITDQSRTYMNGAFVRPS